MFPRRLIKSACGHILYLIIKKQCPLYAFLIISKLLQKLIDQVTITPKENRDI